MKLIIQIPCYNEEATLGVTLSHLPKAIPGVDIIEYLVIDDGSTDNTAQVALDLGVSHVVRLKANRGLARGFMAGIDASLRCGADIIVNTDADDQYNGEDIEKLIRPILDGKAEIVVGARPIDDIPSFSATKKKLQHVGSFVVRAASGTDIPDAPSGFRAFSREAALRLNVINDYTYTLETIVQAGRERTPIVSVPIRTNEELRPSRLFKGISEYVKRSVVTILRAYMMYQPFKVFTLISLPLVLIGIAIGIRFLWFRFHGDYGGHVQSLILACTLVIVGFLTFMIGLLGDVISANRKILQDVQYHVRRMDYGDQQAGDEGTPAKAGSEGELRKQCSTVVDGGRK